MNLRLPLDEPRSVALSDAVDRLATSGGLEERGAVFTKGGVVEAILDLCGYTTDQQLHEHRLLEPSFGDGDFLLPAVRRLIDAFRASGNSFGDAAEVLGPAVRAVELHRETFEATSALVFAELCNLGLTESSARQLVDCWLIHDDFLLADFGDQFDFIVGNPPYVRQERIPAALLKEYKWRFATLYDRADLYVLFYERSLDLLTDGGVLGFICANRWLKNKYGGPLREKVGGGFHVKYFIDMERADAFNSEVIAYPAITIIQRAVPGRTVVALGGNGASDDLGAVVERLEAASEENGLSTHTEGVAIVEAVASGKDPWLLDTPEILALIRELERVFPALEDSGAMVGIGVATGADRVFIGPYDELPVEPARKLRLAKAGDCTNERLTWGGHGIVNPYLETGELASFDRFPRFAAYLNEHAAVLKRRHTAKQRPAKWYKTIDRIYPQLTARPKLLIPDIKGEATVAYDEGRFYPHHNLYVVTSEIWDLRALQTILRSSVALMFIAAYCVRMSGGFLRFQAQYLRRIRCPRWIELPPSVQQSLVEAASNADQDDIDSLVLPLYGLSGERGEAVRTYAREARVARKDR